MMNDERGMMNLEKIKERESKATPGPWTTKKGSTCHHVLSDDRQFETGCINLNGKSPYDADFIAHARQDIPVLILEIERLQAERQNHTLIHNDALRGLVAENERLYKGNVFSCGCRFSASPIGWAWNFCDAHARTHLQARALANLRAAAQVVIEQTDRDLAVGLGRQFSRLDIYEIGLTGEQIEALRAALEGNGHE